MGFFSWQCAKTKKPVMAHDAVVGSPYEFSSEVVVLFKNGSQVRGRYDGYGRVYGDVLFELVECPESDWRMIIKDYYDGEEFEQLPQNRPDPGQGFFYGDEDLQQIF